MPSAHFLTCLLVFQFWFFQFSGLNEVYYTSAFERSEQLKQWSSYQKDFLEYLADRSTPEDCTKLRANLLAARLKGKTWAKRTINELNMLEHLMTHLRKNKRFPAAHWKIDQNNPEIYRLAQEQMNADCNLTTRCYFGSPGIGLNDPSVSSSRFLLSFLHSFISFHVTFQRSERTNPAVNCVHSIEEDGGMTNRNSNLKVSINISLRFNCY